MVLTRHLLQFLSKATKVQASASGAKVESSVPAKELITSHESEVNKTVVGYMVVRAEGSLRNHDASLTYFLKIDAASTVA